jgi:hypothetical protein
MSPLESPDFGMLLEERTDLRTDNGDHDKFSHYVRKEKILESAMSGKPVIALCGKVWVPGHDPEKYPVCPDCKKIFQGLPGGDKPSDKE